VKINGLKKIALFECSKGLIVLLGSFGIFSGVIGKQALNYLHVTPQNLSYALWLAMLYISMRFIEAFGLWFETKWGKWMAIISTAAYLPFELIELSKGVTVFKISITSLNLAILSYLIFKKQQVND
jgi:uncharacterized membrane protein (DUF2068 family)